MWIQNLLVGCLVSACFAYAASQLLPLAVRQALARALLRLPLPAFWGRRLEKIALAKGGCGSDCDGCDRSPSRAVLPGRHKKRSSACWYFTRASGERLQTPFL